MSRRHSPAVKSKALQLIDDFTRIKGIGPTINARLHQNGICTFAQLAASSPDELAACHLNRSADRITRENWIKHAHRLAAKQTRKVRSPATPAGRPQHYATFTIELLLEADNEVRRTRATHIQTGRESVWAGWDAVRLNDFMADCTAWRSSLAKPTPRVLPVTPLVASPATAYPLSTLRIRDLKITTIDHTETADAVKSGCPFQVVVNLSLSEVMTSGTEPFTYYGALYAKGLGSGLRQIAGEAKGQLGDSEAFTILVDGNILVQGLYRLKIVVTLTSQAGTRSTSSRLTAIKEVGLLQIY